MQLTTLSLSFLLVCQTVCGMHFSFGRNTDNNPVTLEPSHIEKSYEALLSRNKNFEIYNSPLNQTNDNITESSEFTNDSTSNQSASPASSTRASLSTSNIPNGENSTTVVSNKPQSSTQLFSSGSPTVTNGRTTSVKQLSTLTTPSNNETTNETTLTTDDDEPEGVARGKPTITESITTTSPPQTLYQKGLTLIHDPYILSILVPVTAGVVFATTIILTIATCRCIRRRCIRRRLRRKALPDSVKNLRPSDRARLLAESSDEEF